MKNQESTSIIKQLPTDSIILPKDFDTAKTILQTLQTPKDIIEQIRLLYEGKIPTTILFESTEQTSYEANQHLDQGYAKIIRACGQLMIAYLNNHILAQAFKKATHIADIGCGKGIASANQAAYLQSSILVTDKQNHGKQYTRHCIDPLQKEYTQEQFEMQCSHNTTIINQITPQYYNTSIQEAPHLLQHPDSIVLLTNVLTNSTNQEIQTFFKESIIPHLHPTAIVLPTFFVHNQSKINFSAYALLRDQSEHQLKTFLSAVPGVKEQIEALTYFPSNLNRTRETRKVDDGKQLDVFIDFYDQSGQLITDVEGKEESLRLLTEHKETSKKDKESSEIDYQAFKQHQYRNAFPPAVISDTFNIPEDSISIVHEGFTHQHNHGKILLELDQTVNDLIMCFNIKGKAQTFTIPINDNRRYTALTTYRKKRPEEKEALEKLFNDLGFEVLGRIDDNTGLIVTPILRKKQ